MQPELQAPSDLEARLAEAASRARATRTVGGTLSPRAARDLRLRLFSDPEAVTPDAAPAAAAAQATDEVPGPSSGSRPSAIRVERRRWARDATPERIMSPAVTAPVIPAPARPRTGRTRRWAALGRLAVLLVVAAVLIGAATYASGRLTTPTVLTATVVDATGATATRVGAPIQLAAGTVLQVGDTISVSSQGQAVLAPGRQPGPPGRWFGRPSRAGRRGRHRRLTARRARLLPRGPGRSRPLPRHHRPGDLDGGRHGLRHRPRTGGRRPGFRPGTDHPPRPAGRRHGDRPGLRHDRAPGRSSHGLHRIVHPYGRAGARWRARLGPRRPMAPGQRPAGPGGRPAAWHPRRTPAGGRRVAQPEPGALPDPIDQPHRQPRPDLP